MMTAPCLITDIEVQFDSARYVIIEDSGEVELTVKTDKVFEYPFTVPVVTVDGNANCKYICGHFQYICYCCLHTCPHEHHLCVS